MPSTRPRPGPVRRRDRCPGRSRGSAGARCHALPREDVEPARVLDRVRRRDLHGRDDLAALAGPAGLHLLERDRGVDVLSGGARHRDRDDEHRDDAGQRRDPGRDALGLERRAADGAPDQAAEHAAAIAAGVASAIVSASIEDGHGIGIHTCDHPTRPRGRPSRSPGPRPRRAAPGARAGCGTRRARPAPPRRVEREVQRRVAEAGADDRRGDRHREEVRDGRQQRTAPAQPHTRAATSAMPAASMIRIG